MKQLGFILALIFILMPMVSLAQDRISENLNLKNELYLKSFDFEPKQIDTEDSEQTVNFLATIYAKNGIMNNSSTGFATQVTFLGPHSFGNRDAWFAKPEKNVLFLPPSILGDAINGTYKAALNFPKGTAGGVWQMESIKLVDSKGQIRELKGDDLASLPQELHVKVGWGKWFWILALIPAIFAAILLLIFGIFGKSIRKFPGLANGIRDISKGHDDATSSSKFQFLLWVCVVLYAYIIVISDAYMNHRMGSLGLSVPDNLLLAMGLSTTTMLAAKGITSKYVEEGKIDKSKTKDNGGGLLKNDAGDPDLSQIQLISWTLIGVGIFLLKTLSDVIGSPGAVAGLPDIDQTLLMLMGIGQGAYIGKKIITTVDPEAPKLDNMNPKRGTLDEWISLTGKNFGEKDAGSITINGKTVQFKEDSQLKWTEQLIQFKLRDIDVDKDKDLKKYVTKGNVVKIGVIADKKSSAKKEDFNINADLH